MHSSNEVGMRGGHVSGAHDSDNFGGVVKLVLVAIITNTVCTSRVLIYMYTYARYV